MPQRNVMAVCSGDQIVIDGRWVRVHGVGDPKDGKVRVYMDGHSLGVPYSVDATVEVV